MRRSDTFGDRKAGTVVAVMSARRASRPGAAWGVVFGLTVAATMASYKSSFPTAASRANLLRTFQGNAAFEALFGLLRHLDTVAGYTAYKDSMTLILVGAVWGLLIATKLLRGEEETGRWDLLVAGQTTRSRATAQAAVGLGVGAVALWLPTAVLTAAGGSGSSVDISVGASLYFATSIVAAVVMFMAIGMVVSQLATTRHDANLIGGGILTASYLVRMAADSDPRIGWLRWGSPLGWIEQLRPLIGSDPVAFVPIALLSAVLVVVAVRAAARRDVGAGLLPAHDTRPPRTALLGSQAGLTVRLTAPSAAAWLAAIGITGLVFGLVTQAAGRSLKSSPTIARVIGRLGATGAGPATYLGFVFLIAAGLIAVAAAGQVTALRGEEETGRLDNLLVRPVARWRWLLVRIGVGLGLVVVAGIVTGAAAWIGAVSQHAAVSFGSVMQAGINIVPPSVFVLGIGVLAFGLWPRAAVAVTYGLIAWSILIETFAGISRINHWVRDASPFLHIRPAPAANPDWQAALWLAGLGLLAAVAGIAAFDRRDIEVA